MSEDEPLWNGGQSSLFEETPVVTLDFTVTKVTPVSRDPQYYSRHDLLRAAVMTRLWRNSLEAAAAIGTIVLGTLLVHLAMTWWSASAALH
jgi:hypothetical protein